MRGSALDAFLISQIYAWLLVFTRIGTAFSIMPTMAEPFISTRIRLLLALMISVVVAPYVRQYLPPMPKSGLGMAMLIGQEVLIGIFIGTLARLLMSALETAGMIIAIQSSLANAFVFNPAMASQGSLPGALMGMVGVLLLFAADLHHMLILAAVDSYTLFEAGAPLPLGDFAKTIVEMVSRSFLLGVQLSAPFLVTGLLFALALGLIARLMPQIQVFFIFMSAQVGIGLFLFGLTLSAMMLYWLQGFEATMINLLNPN
ncbi:MAG TPA: flagellar biosynthetic protein FliR [Azospirillaceae bacterium]|nr:flagellar biosynthetic protein FliR [Azospirillaceae bacterium]